MFAVGLGDWGLIPVWVIPKTQKMVLDATLLSTQQYNVQIKGKVEHPSNGIVPFLRPKFRSYWKGSLCVTLNYGCQLYFLFIYIHTHTHIFSQLYASMIQAFCEANAFSDYILQRQNFWKQNKIFCSLQQRSTYFV